MTVCKTYMRIWNVMNYVFSSFDGVKDVRLASVPYGVILALNSPEMIQILLNWGEIKENCLPYFYICV